MDHQRVYGFVLKQKLQQLETLEKQIVSLEQQLKAARELRIKLRQDLEIFQRGGPSIQKLPPEVLAIIFRNYLDENPSTIRRLLLVCRQWHSLVKTNSNFWSIICIAPGGYDDLDTLKSRQHYIKACLRNSGNLPLDITINYGQPNTLVDLCMKALQKIVQQLRCSNYAHLKEIVFDVKEEEWMARSWLDSERFDNLEPDRDSLMLRYEELCAQLLRELIGKRGEHMLRWRSFHFTGPTWGEGALHPAHIYSPLRYPTPMLEQLSLVGFLTFNYSKGRGVFSEIRQLRSLSLGYSLTLAELFSGQPLSNLEHLVLEYDSMVFEELKFPSSFVDLKTLCLSTIWGLKKDDMDMNGATFEELITLELQGDFDPEIFVHMSMPKLQHLVLGNYGAFESVLDAQFISILPHLELRFEIERNMALKYLYRFKSIEILQVYSHHEALFKDIIAHLFSARGHVQKLRTLLLTGDGKRLDRSIAISYPVQEIQFCLDSK